MRAGTVERLAGRGLLAIALALAVSMGPMGASDALAQDPDDSPDFSGADLTAQQKLDFAATTADTLEAATNKILGLIEAAQSRKDVILLNCLNDKLISLRGLLKVAEDGKLNLQEAIARENADLQEHNYRKVAIAADQSRLIIAEAEACVGDLGYSQSGGTIVSVTVDGESSEGDDQFGSPSDSATRPADSSPDN